MERMSAIEYRTRFLRSVGAALLLAAVPSGGLFAQPPVNEEPSNWLVGASLGVPGVDPSQLESELFTVGVHATRVVPGRLGGDFAVGTMPRILFDGVLPLGARAGLALPLALSENVLLVPSGGASLVAALGSDGGSADAGLNVGGAAMVLGEGYGGLRAGFTWHWFRDRGGPVWLLEFGFVRRR
ncbi:MAG TPA: hypothetical protein VF188_02460 [Longimicrobiales bacterium]